MKLRNLAKELEDETAFLREWMSENPQPNAKVFRYAVTMKYLGLHLHDPKSDQNLYVRCGGCSFLETRTKWDAANLEVSLTNAEDSKFRLQDAEADFRVECQAVYFSTEKWWFFDNGDMLTSKDAESKTEMIMDSRYFDELKQRQIELDSRQNSQKEVAGLLQSCLLQIGPAQAELWSYRAQSQLLDIRVQAATSKQNLHITCGGCHYFKTKAWWDSASIQIEYPSTKPQYRLYDAGAGCIIECDFLQFTTNVPPIFNLSRTT